MARKSKQGALEDLIGIAAMLPWWVGVLMALITYFVLHHYATGEIAPPTTAAQLGANVAAQLGKTLAMFGQYIVPLAFIIGAGISAYGRHKRSALLAGVRSEPSASALNGMTWQEFEMLVGEAFRRGGYSVAETGGGGADGGVDLVLRKDGEKFLAQCKQWKAYKVGVTSIRELYGVMAASGAAGGVVVTSGVFTQEARDFAAGLNIDLIDGAELHEIIKQIQPASSHEERVLSMTGQLCPKCGGLMVMRTAKQGVNIGKSFWGCPNFPQCRGTVPIG
jgi:restriction system protein